MPPRHFFFARYSSRRALSEQCLNVYQASKKVMAAISPGQRPQRLCLSRLLVLVQCSDNIWVHKYSVQSRREGTVVLLLFLQFCPWILHVFSSPSTALFLTAYSYVSRHFVYRSSPIPKDSLIPAILASGRRQDGSEKEG